MATLHLFVSALIVAARSHSGSTLSGIESSNAPFCDVLSSTAIHVNWTTTIACSSGVYDQYYIAVYRTLSSATAAARPPVVVTAASETGCSAVVDDLVPDKTLYLRVRGHRASAPSVVRGWDQWNASDLMGVIQCSTLPRHPAATAELRPVPLHSGTVGGVQLQITALKVGSSVELRWARLGNTPGARASALSRQWRAADVGTRDCDGNCMRVDAGVRSATVDGLVPGGEYTFVANEGDPVRARASPGASGVKFEAVYRVSEGTGDIDFLPNHNAGDLLGEAAFLSDSSNFAVPPGEVDRDPCAQALSAAAPECQRLGARDGQKCLGCLQRVWRNGTGPAANTMRRQCSAPAAAWPDDNKMAEAWLVFPY